MTDLGKALRQWRKMQKRSLRAQGSEWGVSGQFVHQVESGQVSMPVWMLEALPREFRLIWAEDVAERRRAATQRRRESA